jgi:hypothetical protein
MTGDIYHYRTKCDITDEKYRSFIETVRSELESMVNNGKKLKVGINNIKYYFIFTNRGKGSIEHNIYIYSKHYLNLMYL